MATMTDFQPNIYDQNIPNKSAYVSPFRELNKSSHIKNDRTTPAFYDTKNIFHQQNPSPSPGFMETKKMNEKSPY